MADGRSLCIPALFLDSFPLNNSFLHMPIWITRSICVLLKWTAILLILASKSFLMAGSRCQCLIHSFRLIYSFYDFLFLFFNPPSSLSVSPKCHATLSSLLHQPSPSSIQLLFHHFPMPLLWLGFAPSPSPHLDVLAQSQSPSPLQNGMLLHGWSWQSAL